MPALVKITWVIGTFGEHGMGLLPATLGIGSDWTRWRLLRHLLPLYPAPAAWRLSQLAPRLTKSDDDPGCRGHVWPSCLSYMLSSASVSCAAACF